MGFKQLPKMVLVLQTEHVKHNKLKILLFNSRAEKLLAIKQINRLNTYEIHILMVIEKT